MFSLDSLDLTDPLFMFKQETYPPLGKVDLWLAHEFPDLVVCGVDEAGAGPLAGPVTAAAVILPTDLEVPFLNDSKKMTALRRDKAFEIITASAVYAVVSIPASVIDQIGIRPANLQAMQRAVELLSIQPGLALVDFHKIPMLDVTQLPLTKGDQRSAAIAAASVVAKVTRDRYMAQVDIDYPGYGLASNAGYGTKQHRDAIKMLGFTPEHRRSFTVK